MTRHFDPTRPVDRADVRSMLELAIRAPSAGHTQGWEFLVLDDITSRSDFWSLAADGPPDAWRSGMQHAPVLIVCWSDAGAYLDRYAEPDKGWFDRSMDRWPIPYWHVDVGMAAMILLLAAQDSGFGACWFGLPADRWDSVRARFGVERGRAPVGIVAVGYAADASASRPSRRGRRPWEQVVRFAADDQPDASDPV